MTSRLPGSLLLILGVIVLVLGVSQATSASNAHYDWCNSSYQGKDWLACVVAKDPDAEAGTRLQFVGLAVGAFGFVWALSAAIWQSNRRVCPACREMVRRKATVCRYCRTPLPRRSAKGAGKSTVAAAPNDSSAASRPGSTDGSGA